MFRYTTLRSMRHLPSTARFFGTRPSLFQQQPSPQQPEYQAPASNPPSNSPPPHAPNPHREVYKSGGAGRVVAYNFLIAMLTFQALYWGWTKLESLEVEKEKGEELKSLEGELKELIGREK